MAAASSIGLLLLLLCCFLLCCFLRCQDSHPLRCKNVEQCVIGISEFERRVKFFLQVFLGRRKGGEGVRDASEDKDAEEDGRSVGKT